MKYINVLLVGGVLWCFGELKVFVNWRGKMFYEWVKKVFGEYIVIISCFEFIDRF